MEDQLLLLLPFKKSVSSERVCSLSWWLDEVEKTYCCSGLTEAVVPVRLQFMDLMARRTSRRGIGVG